jgi:hypothetical protein
MLIIKLDWVSTLSAHYTTHFAFLSPLILVLIGLLCAQNVQDYRLALLIIL